MRKGDDGETGGKKRGKKKKIKTFLVATNVVASRPPERRPTGTVTVRANTFESSGLVFCIFKFALGQDIFYILRKNLFAL